MNSMTELTNTGDQINDTIVQLAMIALQPFQVKEPADIAPMLLFWIHRAEMTDADVAEVAKRMFPKPLPLMECPSWCDGDHHGVKPNAVEDLFDHYRDLVEEHDDDGRIKLWVSVHVVDDLGRRRRCQPGILVQTDETLSPDQARRLVTAVEEGLRILSA